MRRSPSSRARAEPTITKDLLESFDIPPKLGAVLGPGGLRPFAAR